jgi:hypothetical protein
VATGTSTISATLGGVSGSTTLTVTQTSALVPVAVKDISEGGYYQYGIWTSATGGYNGSYVFADPQTSPSASNRWNLTVPAGTYDIYATWVAAAGNGTNVGYSVYDGFTKLGSYQANQQLTPADGQYGGAPWAKLGTITVTNGKLTVAMSATGANGDIVADGILLTAHSVGGTAFAVVGMGAGSDSTPSATPMGPLGPSNPPAPDQGGVATGTSSPTTVAASPPGAAGSPAPITVMYAADSGTGSNPGTAPSTSPSSSLIDHAIAELGKGHPRKHRGAILERLARSRAAHGHPSAGQHHSKW